MSSGCCLPTDAVDVHVYGALQKRFGAPTPFQAVRRRVTVHDRSIIAEILGEIGIAPEEVSHLFLNGEYSAAGRRAKPGDRLAVFGRDMALLYRQYFPKLTD